MEARTEVSSPQAVELYSLREEVEGELRQHSVLHISDSGWNTARGDDTYNILMADVSGSMARYWNEVVRAWNGHVANNLTGRTEIYVFESELHFIREGTELKESDFESGGTDLCLALSKVKECVEKCAEKWVRVFLITDGHHSSTREDPENVIEKMLTPPSKRCEVYLLGIGSYFPVKYSVEIRSRLHNGSANMPTLYWAKGEDDIVEQGKIMETYLKKSKVAVKLSHPGSLVPGAAEDTREFYTGEWVYMSCVPDALKSLEMWIEGDKVDISLEALPLTLDILLDSIVPQWNSVLIQRHNLKELIPKDVFPFMERVFRYLYNRAIPSETGTPSSGAIRYRLAARNKEVRGAENRFRNIVKRSRDILTTEKFMNDMELADSVLCTTVTTRKYAVKGLQLKGHTEEDHAKDYKDFMDAYVKVKEKLNALEVTPEDCCRVTMTSTIGDLKDEDFPQLLKLNKFEFLKTFSMSGIPIFSRSRDSTELNPWSFKVDRILTSPFSVLSQVAMEEFAKANSEAALGRDKDVCLQQDNEDSSYNAVVPVFPPAAANVLKPLVCTNLYATCATFALLKNPHIVDYTIHLAGLGATWVKTLADYPVSAERPEFVKERLRNVEATAMIYMDRPSLSFYLKELQTNPGRALMSECPRQDPEDRLLKCEALLKPLFLLHMAERAGRPVAHEVVADVVRLATVEFLGRCLKRTARADVPFITCFMRQLTEEEKRKEWLRERLQSFSEKILIAEGESLSNIYYPERIPKYVRRLLRKKREDLLKVLVDSVEPEAVTTAGLEKLYSVHNCGDVSWGRLQLCAVELGLSESEVQEIFSEKQAFVYVHHALTYTNSSERMKADVVDYDTSLEKVKWKLVEELRGCATKMIQEEIQSAFIKRWYEEYDSCHGMTIVIKPMKREEILVEAKARGIGVKEETFDKVYPRYDAWLGLLRNACQSPFCPFYLIPNRSFNQHLNSERRSGRFLHRFHHVARGEGDTKAKLEFIKSYESNSRRSISLELMHKKQIENLSLFYAQF